MKFYINSDNEISKFMMKIWSTAKKINFIGKIIYNYHNYALILCKNTYFGYIHVFKKINFFQKNSKFCPKFTMSVFPRWRKTEKTQKKTRKCSKKHLRSSIAKNVIFCDRKKIFFST